MLYKQEVFTDVRYLYEKMVYGYWYATPENKDHVPVDYDWAAYETLDKMGALKLYTARLNNLKLVGVNLYVVINALHHKDHLVANCDTLAVDIAYRGRGIAMELMRVAETDLWAQGVHEIVHTKRCVLGGNDTLFTAHGYEKTEVSYHKKRKL